MKPVLHGCQNLIRDEKFNTEELRQKLAEDLEYLRKAIPPFDQDETDPSNIDKWFAFHISRLRNFKNGLEDYQHLYNWLRTCYDNSDKETAHFFVFFELSRDEEMRYVVFDDSHRVREFFRDRNSPGNVYMQKLATWFLGRYDLDSGFIVLNTLIAGASEVITQSLRFKIGKDFLRRLMGPAFWFSCVLTIFLFLGAAGYLHIKTFEFLSSRLMPRWSPTVNSPRVKTWAMLLCLVFTLITLLYLIIYLRRGWHQQIRKLLPRLIGVLLLGYIPLMSSEDVWKWILTLPILPSLFIWLLALGFSYLYLYVKAHDTLSDGEFTPVIKREIIIRAAQVFLIGLTEAYVIGIVLCELLGYTALNGLISGFSSDDTYYVIKGWIGTLIPRVVLLYAPEAGHIFRPTPNSDWGIDGEIEFKNERGETSGQRVYLQLKSGNSYLRTRKTDDKEIFSIKNPRQAEYWQSHAYPILLVIRDSGGQIRWMNVTEYLQRQGTNVRQIEFRGEPFTAESVNPMCARFAR